MRKYNQAGMMEVVRVQDAQVQIKGISISNTESHEGGGRQVLPAPVLTYLTCRLSSGGRVRCNGRPADRQGRETQQSF